MALKDRFRELRLALGLTQEALAKRANPKWNHVYAARVESGANQLSSREAHAAFARAFELSSSDFSAYLDGTLSLEEARARIGATATAAPELRVEREEVRTPGATETPLETALFRVMNRDEFTAADFDGARRASHEGFKFMHPNADFEAMARGLLVAARQLRVEGLSVTPGAILARAASGKTLRAQEVDRELGERMTAEAREAARAAGYEPDPALGAALKAQAQKTLKKRRPDDE